ncbi:NarL family transcriptional regulator [Taibaiella sp. KBW10]|uniref:DegT/DnrJ/EryC1/StrS family aminotransferase n=1 Tax=Taibaiella sp. KBW10 TaxID=2153357 RepID=UPI000F59FDAE|nr:aminotransferase class I/II-fold pyridoxal phosphate-dependent enzyme [Taibaiella sp. KBW10]RQO31730.1 NarL family transcriptional regulator [Taibaiella sp. KBW10]
MSTNQYPHVPYGKTVHGQEEIDAVVEVLQTSTQMGKNVRALEETVAGLYAKKYGIGVNSGSSALYLAADLMDFEAGSEILTPALTFSTTVAPIVKKGWIPAFIDAAEGTYNVDVAKVEEMITSKTKAMIIPNLIGNLPDWKVLRELADKYNLFVLEDSADTLGAEIGGASSGRFTDMSTTSFYGSHIVNCAGNGGMICVNTDAFYDRGRLLRSWGRSSSLFVESEKIENRFNVEVDGIPYDAKFVFEEPGYNIEPSELGAAFGLVQVKKLGDNIDKRTAHYHNLRSFFEQYEEYFILPNQLPDSRTGWLAFAVTVRESAPFIRRDLQIFLEKRNIQTRTVFTGNILRQPGFKNVAHKASAQGYPEADKVMRGGMLMACHHGLNEEQIAHMKESVSAFMSQFGK